LGLLISNKATLTSSLEGDILASSPISKSTSSSLPIIIGTGIGSDVMKRIAAPMVGGIMTSFLMELTVYPAIFYLIKRREMRKELGTQAVLE